MLENLTLSPSFQKYVSAGEKNPIEGGTKIITPDEVYTVGHGNTSMKGFGGHKFYIYMLDGRVIQSTDLWFNRKTELADKQNAFVVQSSYDPSRDYFFATISSDIFNTDNSNKSKILVTPFFQDNGRPMSKDEIIARIDSPESVSTSDIADPWKQIVGRALKNYVSSSDEESFSLVRRNETNLDINIIKALSESDYSVRKVNDAIRKSYLHYHLSPFEDVLDKVKSALYKRDIGEFMDFDMVTVYNQSRRDIIDLVK